MVDCRARAINRVTAACRAAGMVIIHAATGCAWNGSNTGRLGEISPLVKNGTSARVRNRPSYTKGWP